MSNLHFNVLVAEDNPADAHILSRQLRDTPLNLEICNNVADTIELVKQGDYHCVIADFHIHEKTAIDLLQGLGPMQHRPPVVVLTSGAGEHAAAQTILSGASDYMLKSEISADMVSMAVRHAIDKHKLECALAERNAELIRSASEDNMTGLANGAAFRARIEDAVVRVDRNRTSAAVLYIDLDGFKAINDTFGHSAGDKALVAFAQRLRAHTRSTDFVGRLGGDEFAVLLEGLESHVYVEQIVEKLLDATNQPIDVGRGAEASIGASVGIAVREPGDDTTGDELLQRSDEAMYTAKKRGKHRSAFYASGMDNEAKVRRYFREGLTTAFNENQLKHYYQPIINTTDESIAGFEALIRWDHPDVGMVQPDTFIPILEELGLMPQVAQWSLVRTLTEFAAWQSQAAHNIHLAVNMSATQIMSKSIVAVVASALQESGVDADSLYLEITENVAIDNMDRALENLHAIQRMGVAFSLDDFGTGYASLTHLARLPISVLKIDKSFVQRIGTPENRNIVTATIRLAHSMGLRVVAEGVEEEAQLEYLRALRCDFIQGYYYSPPMASSHIGSFLGRGPRRK